MPSTVRPLVSALPAFAAASFLLNFAWEMLQAPFFAEMPDMPHWEAVLICLQATVGDVVITLAGFAAAGLIDRRALWFERPSRRALLTYLATGIVITMLVEWHAVATDRWKYADIMPVLPWVGVGVMPILQWAVLPGLILVAGRRYNSGAFSEREAG